LVLAGHHWRCRGGCGDLVPHAPPRITLGLTPRRARLRFTKKHEAAEHRRTNMADNQTGARRQPSSGAQARDRGQGTQDGSFADQAQSSMRNKADRASEMWDDMSDRGQRYYRQGSRAVGDLDSTTLSGFLIAGAIGFGIAWLTFGRSSSSGEYVARRMSQSSERYR